MLGSILRSAPFALAAATACCALAIGGQDGQQDAPPADPPLQVIITRDAPAPKQDEAAPQTSPAPKEPGKVIEGPINVYSWAPADSAKAVDAKDIDLALSLIHISEPTRPY